MSIQREALCSSCRVNTAHKQVFGRTFCNTCLENLSEAAKASATPIAVEIRENYPGQRLEPKKPTSRTFEIKVTRPFTKK